MDALLFACNFGLNMPDPDEFLGSGISSATKLQACKSYAYFNRMITKHIRRKYAAKPEFFDKRERFVNEANAIR